MSNDFLHKEYELCFVQLRFYDQRQIDLLRYLVTLTSSVAAAQFALYKFFESPSRAFLLCLAFLAAIVCMASLLIFLAMLQNRLYFVYIARQINAIRGHLLQHEAPEFKNNQLYTSTDFSAIKPRSIHTFMLIGSALLGSLFVGTFVYALCFLYSTKPFWPAIVTTAVITLIMTCTGGYQYLKVQGDKSADVSVHYKNPGGQAPDQRNP